MLLLAYIPCDLEEEAKRISEILLRERLIACANIIRSNSIFNWKGKPEDSVEWIILAKTTPENFDELNETVCSLHSYDVPCVVAMPLSHSNEEYEKWAREELK